MKPALTGMSLLKTAVNQVLAHPQTWDQTEWHSDGGTKHCIGGWCQIIAGFGTDLTEIYPNTKNALGLRPDQVKWLFSTERTLAEIYYFANGLDAKLAQEHGNKPFIPFEL